MVVKICKVHGALTENEVYLIIRKELKNAKQFKCKSCKKNSVNNARIKIKKKDPAKYAGKIKEWRDSYNKKYPEKVRVRDKNKSVEKVKNLKNHYVRIKIARRFSAPGVIFSQDFIDFYRAYMMLKRLIREKRK